jgi:ketosteroid isomerase-like protein
MITSRARPVVRAADPHCSRGEPWLVAVSICLTDEGFTDIVAADNQHVSFKGRAMKRFLATGVIIVLSLGGVLAQGGNAGGTVAKSLMDMENQWTKASKAGNADALAPMLSDVFVALDSDGTMHTKTEVLDRTKKAKWVTNEIADMKVTVHGDTAIVTGSWTGKGTDGAGKPVDAKERWADTWVKGSDGKWQCLASASAPIK